MSEIAEKAAREIVEQIQLWFAGKRGFGELEIKAIVERAIAESQAPKPGKKENKMDHSTLAGNVYEQDPGGNSTLTRLDAELAFNKETEDWKPVTDSSLTYGDLRLLQEFVMGVEAERYHNTMVGPLPKRKAELGDGEPSPPFILTAFVVFNSGFVQSVFSGRKEAEQYAAKMCKGSPEVEIRQVELVERSGAAQEVSPPIPEPSHRGFES